MLSSSKILCIGAHPDDCELGFAGTAAKFAAQGHAVKFLSVTDGRAGHQSLDPGRIAQIRKGEAKEAARRLGIAEAEVLSNADGRLTPTIEIREQIVRAIRGWKSDIVLTHRPWDYHPDHRYTSQLVQDSAYLVLVPHFAPETPALNRNPIFLYLEDFFRLPVSFAPDIAVNIADVWDQKLAALDAHASQFYSWLPWVEGVLNELDGILNEVPETKDARKEWLTGRYGHPPSPCTRAALARRYGQSDAEEILHAEAFQICEYGRQPAPGELDELFPQ